MAIWICKIYARYESCKECYYTNSHRCRSNYRVNIATIVHVALASLCSYCAQYEQYIVANTDHTLVIILIIRISLREGRSIPLVGTDAHCSAVAKVMHVVEVAIDCCVADVSPFAFGDFLAEFAMEPTACGWVECWMDVEF